MTGYNSLISHLRLHNYINTTDNTSVLMYINIIIKKQFFFTNYLKKLASTIKTAIKVSQNYNSH